MRIIFIAILLMVIGCQVDQQLVVPETEADFGSVVLIKEVDMMVEADQEIIPDMMVALDLAVVPDMQEVDLAFEPDMMELSLDMEVEPETMELPVGPGDTPALGCTGDYCPAARISMMTVPESAREATTGGCRLLGSGNGSAFNGLSLLSGLSINELVQPDANGDTPLYVLNYLSGWSMGQTGNQAGALTSQFFQGELDQNGSSFISSSSLNDQGDALISLSTEVIDGLYYTAPSRFNLSFPFVNDLQLNIILEQTSIYGLLELDEIGFNLSDGVIQGYLTQDGIRSLIQNIQSACAMENPPSLCATIGSFLNGDIASGESLIVSILGGYEVAVSAEGVVSECPNSSDCNAVGVCLLVEMSSVHISGVASP